MSDQAPADPRIEILMQQVSNLTEAIRERDEIARVAAITAAQARDQTPTILTEPKVPLPEKFDGSRQKLRGFLNQLTLLFTLNPTRYANDQIRIAITGTLLTGDALQWYNPLLESPKKHSETLASWESFTAAMKSTFGELDKELAASYKIRNLRQNLTSTSQYAANFQHLASDLQWNDTAFMAQFREGLSEEVKDMLLHHDSPSSLASMVALAIRCDNRWRERQLQKNQKIAFSPNNQQFRPQTAQFPATALLPTVPLS
jgi:hypothetical protein